MGAEVPVSAQEFERSWWGNCANTFHEEQKQLVYAYHMGIYPLAIQDYKHPPTFNLGGRLVVDVGGGPASLLLKCVTFAVGSVVVDPCSYPEWVAARYKGCGIDYQQERGEDFVYLLPVDEVWIYNCLQHVEDPQRIVRNARKGAKLVRIFEWLDIPAHEGHPNVLTVSDLNRWLGVSREPFYVNDSGAVGAAYAAVVG